MSYTLCVIDMQNYFNASKGKRVRNSCIREIKKAIKDKATILFVEYNNYGPTLSLLTDITQKAKYKKAYHVIKYSDDGGQEINDFIVSRHLPRLNFRMCGINTPYCVRATVSKLASLRKNSNIQLVADACDSNNRREHISGLKTMQNLANVKLIRKPTGL